MRRAPARAALALLAVPAWSHAADAPRYPEGAASFKANCAVCHGPAGAGIPGLAPPLTHYPAVYATHPEGRRQLAMMVLFGMFGDVVVEGRHYNFKMPEFARFGDEQLAATLNFVVFDLGAGALPAGGAAPAPIAGSEVAALRDPRLNGEQVRAHRDALLAELGL